MLHLFQMTYLYMPTEMVRSTKTEVQTGSENKTDGLFQTQAERGSRFCSACMVCFQLAFGVGGCWLLFRQTQIPVVFELVVQLV